MNLFNNHESFYYLHLNSGLRSIFVKSYLDPPLHGNAEEHDEVHYKYWPKHWHIEGFKECANHSDDNYFCCRMPEERSTTQHKYTVFYNY